MGYKAKHEKRNKPHFSVWVMRIAAVLGCLTVISVYMLSGMVAKFSSTVIGSSNSAKVAKFDVKLITVTENDETYLNGLTNEEKTYDTKSYDFSVTNNSEVAVEYDIKILFSKALPKGVVPTVRIANKADVNGTPDSNRKNFTFKSSDFVFSPNNSTNKHTLVIKINYYDEDNNLINVDLTDTEVRISVTAQQVD